MESCEVNTQIEDTFEKIVDAMRGDRYWYRFFVRPCCPAPNVEGAMKMLDRLASDVDANSTFTDEQKAELKAIIEDRKAWYPTSGLCRTALK